ncbi:unnamed protein product [Kluyveromyces dobzhanskii CBS 2104]|uniref:Chloride channel protein n=1 Tax=Kluyveromyces dobzhanskii CBS 2104 TaxID=1427455 RepID=A0A0A8LAG1_9SACH|nr:unnamed protein product [Kluyveromyces dobzhanskii CBS 2104]
MNCQQGVTEEQALRKRPEVANFDKFTSVDWIEEEKRKFSTDTSHENFEIPRSSWYTYRSLLWKRGSSFITLTIIGLSIGSIAGFLQIFTELLVNWKSGHCARNLFLNKAFCCSKEVLSERGSEKLVPALSSAADVFLKRSETLCIENGTWIETRNPILSFILFIFLSVVFAIISCLMVLRIAPFATGSGISEIKSWVSGFQYTPEFLNLKTLIVKSIALPLAISSGLSVGKEGPSVHYATCCGYVITNLLLSKKMAFPEQSEYLIASTAGGVAVAFGAPIGGVLFALEEMSSSIPFKLSTLWKSYYIALAGISALQYIDPSRNGKIVVFEVSYDKEWHMKEIPVFILLGVFGGLYGKYISKWNVHFVSFRKKYLSKWPLQEVVILTAFTAIITYFNEFLKLDMTESMEVLFHECQTNDEGSVWSHRLCQVDNEASLLTFINLFSSLIFATIVRALLIVVSYGCRVPAGIFVPSMAVGATFGRAVSLVVERYITGPNVITPGTYAFLGATAALSGITNLTLTVVVIMFEVTGAFTYILPTMVVVAFTRIIFSSLGAEGGIADQMIIFNGFPLMEEQNGDHEFMDDFYADDIMTKDPICIIETMSRRDLQNLLDGAAADFSGLPIVSCSSPNKLTSAGFVLTRYVRCYLKENTGSPEDIIDFRKFGDEELTSRVNYTPITVSPSTPLSILFMMFQKMGCSTIIVEDGGIMVGLLTKKNVLSFTRIQHTKNFGPLYAFNDSIDKKLIQLIEKCIDIFKRP